MPNNTDNSGSARAARLKKISTAQGPVPAIRPNIGSMALDAVIGKGLCCPAPSETPITSIEFIFISCGIPTQTVSPNIGYIFYNNTENPCTITLTDIYGSHTTYTIGATPGSDALFPPIGNLVSWSTASTSCVGTVTIGVFVDGPNGGCIVQTLSPSVSYQFAPFFDSGQNPPYTITVRDSSGIDTTVSIEDFTPVGPYTNLVSWQTSIC